MVRASPPNFRLCLPTILDRLSPTAHVSLKLSVSPARPKALKPAMLTTGNEGACDWATSDAGNPSAVGSYPKEYGWIANWCRFQLRRAVEIRLGESMEVRLNVTAW